MNLQATCTNTPHLLGYMFKRASMASFLRSAAPPRREWSLEEAALFAARKEFELLKLLSTDKKALATARRLGFLFSQTQMQPQTPPAASAGGVAAARPAGAADDASVAPPAAPRRARRRSARRAQPAEWAHTQPQTHTSAAAADGDAAAPPARVARPEVVRADDAASRVNARQRRSAARSAQRHAARRRPIRTAAQVLTFLLRLRRRALTRRAYVELSSDQMSTYSTRVSVDSMEDAWATPLPSRSSASSKRGRSGSPSPRSAGSDAGRTPPSPGSCASYEPLEDCVDGLCEQCERCAREGRRDHQRLRRAALAMLLAPS